jgi:hypothetical protein
VGRAAAEGVGSRIYIDERSFFYFFIFLFPFSLIHHLPSLPAFPNLTHPPATLRHAAQTYFDVELDSPDVRYLASITVNAGKVYALFVKSPTRLFAANEAALRHIVETFSTV